MVVEILNDALTVLMDTVYRVVAWQVLILNGLFAFWGVGVVLAWGRGLPDD